MEVVDFTNIETPLPDLDEVVWKDLSRDQQLLYRWTKAVASGSVPRTLANQVAGSINHSRWLTLAVRLLQLYTKTTNPSEALKKIIKFIVRFIPHHGSKLNLKASLLLALQIYFIK